MEKRRRTLAPMGRVFKSKGVVDGIIQDDWATIIDICCAGVADRFYSPGDKKLVTGTGGNNYFDYIGTDVDERSDGLDLPVATWMSTGTIVNSKWGTSSNPGDYDLSSVRLICDDVPNTYLSYAIRQVLIPVEKSYTVWSDASAKLVNTKGSYSVWIPDKYELEAEYAARFPDQASRAKTGSTSRYWLRSASERGKVYGVSSSGLIAAGLNVTGTLGVACGFCIGAS